MRWLIFLLVLANLLFFAFSEGYFGKPQNPDAIRMQKQITPENIRVVSRDIPPPISPDLTQPKIEEQPSATGEHSPVDSAAAKPGEICLAWSGLSTNDADRLAALLAEKFNSFKQTRRSDKSLVKSWWVYIPPLSAKADTEKKVEELKKLGIKDSIIAQESGLYRLGISLGVFVTEAAAKTRLAELHNKGIKSAKLDAYNNKESFVLEVRGSEAMQKNLLESTQSISSIKLEAKACQ